MDEEKREREGELALKSSHKSLYIFILQKIMSLTLGDDTNYLTRGNDLCVRGTAMPSFGRLTIK